MLARQANADIRVLVETRKIYLGEEKKGPKIKLESRKEIGKYVLMPASRPFSLCSKDSYTAFMHAL